MRLDEALLSEKTKKCISQSSTYPKASKGYAIRHGVLRGSFDGLSDENILKELIPLDMKSLDEGLYTLVQTGLCRRKVLTLIYGNDTPRESIVIMEILQEDNLPVSADPTVPCCDLCDPTLLDRTCPAPSTSQPKITGVKTGKVNPTVRSALQRWRSQILKRDFEDAVFGSSGFLSDERVENLSSVGFIGRLNKLE